MLARRSLAVLAVVPVGLFCLATVLRELRGPYHLGANSDPEYAYLFNALNILSLQAPDMIEHPGTTVQTLGAVVIVARWLPSLLLGGATNVQDAVIADPEAYLAAISNLFAILVSATTFIAGLLAFRRWGRIVPAVIIQLSPLLFTEVLMALPRVSPESLLITVVLVLIAALVPLVLDGNTTQTGNSAHAIWIGAVIGFGVATKFTFLPFLAFVFLLDGWVRRATAVVVSTIAFFAFTAPAAPNYKWMLLWLQTLATHQGINGSGDSGLPNVTALLGNLNFMTSVAAPLFVLLGLYFIVLLVLSLWSLLGASELGHIRRLVLISCIVLAAQIAATLKNPGTHYLIPSMVICGLPNAAVVMAVTRATPKGWPSIASRFAVAAALIAGLFNSGSGVYAEAVALNSYAQGTRQLEEQVQAKDVTVVSYYRSSLLVYALAFGNDFAKDRYDARLRALYPKAMFYSIWLGRFYSFAGETPDDQISRMLTGGQTVLLYGSPFVGDYAPYGKGLVIEPLLSGPNEAVYRLVRIERD